MADAGANCKKYGLPFYGVSWVPPTAIRSDPNPTPPPPPPPPPEHGDQSSGDGSPSISDDNSLLLFAGGGGEGRSGISNALLLARFDFASNSLSDRPAGIFDVVQTSLPFVRSVSTANDFTIDSEWLYYQKVAKLGTGVDVPYRMIVHPGGDGVICSMPKSCRCFVWETMITGEPGLRRSDRVIDELEDIEQQLALKFNHDGSVLALGGEDGKLRVFKWPSMEIVLDEANSHASVKDLDFSPDGKCLVSVGSGGPGRVWDVTSSKLVASLPKDQDEVFGFCRFSHRDKNPVLYIISMRGQGGSVVRWDTSSWKRVSTKKVVRDPVCAFNVSADGKLLAVGTIEGNVFIINSANMSVQNVVRKAHLGIVTSLMFSEDSRALVSASMDSSARVTVIKDAKKNGFSLWIVIFVILLAIVAYYVKTEGILH